MIATVCFIASALALFYLWKQSSAQKRKTPSHLKSLDEIPGPSLFQVLFNILWTSRLDQVARGKFVFDRPLALWKKYGDIVRISVPFQTTKIFAFRADLIETVCKATGTTAARPQQRGMEQWFARRKNMGQLVPPLFEDENWQNLKRKARNCMAKASSSNQYNPHIDEMVQDFINNVVRPGLNTSNNETPEDFMGDVTRFAFEAVSFLALEKRMGVLAPNLNKDSEGWEMIRAAKTRLPKCMELQNGLGLWTLFPKYCKTFQELSEDMDYFLANIKKHIAEEIAANYDYKKIEVEDPPLFVQFAQKGCTVDEASFIAWAMMAAGIDATAYAAGFALYELAKHPDVQQKLFEAVEKFLPRPDSIVDANVVENMDYVKAVLKETLRLYPASPMLPRIFEGNGLELGGYYIDRKCEFYGDAFSLSRSDIYYDKPLEFRPERWLKDHPLKEDANPYATLPWGHGSRFCLGKQLAELELHIFLIKMVRNFKLEWHRPDMELTNMSGIVPNSPLRLTLLSRT